MCMESLLSVVGYLQRIWPLSDSPILLCTYNSSHRDVGPFPLSLSLASLSDLFGPVEHGKGDTLWLLPYARTLQAWQPPFLPS